MIDVIFIKNDKDKTAPNISNANVCPVAGCWLLVAGSFPRPPFCLGEQKVL